ncbi:thiamine phosphate synthase [Porphyrobacter sp. AAP60]|uniref:thiamine phosphate synthase n=1 Tax=Porphyrobacter sp. AAP60 TaxID=1523423 RepID=UPI0006B953AC|nr:thiamine phosphate synthase [Porphyrobacter sp. AAP60]KPF63934.1 thiamine monophosphate synthase [Porphyrobacter sp. AAP60]
MAALYSGCVPDAKTLPCLWLISDARNDAVLARALAALPCGSGFVFRHYHLEGDARRQRFDTLAAAARARGHCVILSGPADLAQAWGADGVYGPPHKLGTLPGLLRLATAHDAREIELANRVAADGVFLSPVFPTRSHPGGASLGPARFQELAALAQMPVIALGGMTAERAQALDWPRWAAIDGLS